MKRDEFINVALIKLSDIWGYDNSLTAKQLSEILEVFESLGMLSDWESEEESFEQYKDNENKKGYI